MVGKYTGLFLDSIRDVFLGKSVLNFIGFVLHAAMVITLSNSKELPTTAEVNEESPVGGLAWALLAPAISYLVMVAFVVMGRDLINRRMAALTLSKQRENTLKAILAGLSLIPAWAFKGFVATAVAGTAWWTSLVVLGVATLLAVFLEPCPPGEGEVETTLDNMRVTLATCMPLGIGFAVHRMIVVVWRSHDLAFSTIPVTLWYALISTSFGVLMQVFIARALEAAAPTPRGEKSTANLWKAFLMFTSASGNFVVAWAWDSVLEANRTRMQVELNLNPCFSSFGANALWAIMVMVIASLVLIAKARTQDFADIETKTYKIFDAMVVTVCAMNITWSWLDAFVSFWNAKHVDGSFCLDYRGYHVLGAWVFALVTVVVSVALIQGGTQLIEHIKG